MLRPDNPLLPNYKWVPIGYHGRSSSVVVSGTPVRAPARADQGARRSRSPRSARARRLDYEAELGFVVGPGNALGKPIADRQGAGPRVRRGAAERLVGARRAGLGVPAARAVPRQELRHHHLAVDRDAARRSSLTAAPRSRAPTAIRSRCPTCGTTPTSAKADLPSRWRCTCAPRRMKAPVRLSRAQLPRFVLDRGAARRAPHLERLQPASGRPARLGHHLGRDAGLASAR